MGIFTSTLFCEPDVGSIALNMVGSLDNRRFIFNGIVLPKSLMRLEDAIIEVFDIITGRLSDTSTIDLSMIYHINERVAVLGDELSLKNISRQNEHVLNVYLGKSSVPVGSIYLNARGLKPKIIGYADSMRGIRKGKERNDDSIAILSMSYCYGSVVRKIHIGIVADGVSSLGSGYIVSSEAIKIFTSKILHYVYAIQDLTPEVINDLYEETAKALADHNMRNNIRAATTFTAIVYPVLDKAQIVHVGDTRAYLFSKNDLVLLTEDHKIPGTSTLTKALGIMIEEPMTKSIHIDPGDSVVIASDGVYEIVEEDKLREILMTADNLTAVVNNVLTLVKIRRGRDDASIGVIRRLA